jgi:hypothetical protein
MDYKLKYTNFKELGFPVKEVQDKAKLAGKPVPTNNQGIEMCLSYHMFGFCWTNCGKQQYAVLDPLSTSHMTSLNFHTLPPRCWTHYDAEGHL